MGLTFGTSRLATGVALVIVAYARLGAAQNCTPETCAYLNASLPVKDRVHDLLRRMTLQEKVAQMEDQAVALPRLGIPAYGWWNEGLHGVARRGIATVFPQAIGLAATWDQELLHAVGDTVSTEGRAKYNESSTGDKARYFGLTFWSPNINIFRDPRWGRGQETYGEDPYLTGRLGIAFVRGVQGEDAKYLKAIATPKHFAVHSGPESSRHSFNAAVSPHDLEDTYLPAFRAAVMEGHADSVMCAYNAIDGAPACANAGLLREHLVKDWGFKGYVVSDCGAIGDISGGHKYAKDGAEAAAVAVKAGTDLDCGGEYSMLPAAVQRGLITEAEIDSALSRLMTARFRLGMFDPVGMVPWSAISPKENDSEAHRQLALRAARESVVLLKNDGVLPLKASVKVIAIVGPTATSREVMQGNYNGSASHPVFAREGFAVQFKDAKILYAKGAVLADGMKPVNGDGTAEAMIAEAVMAARQADVVFAYVGLSPQLEGEEMKVLIPGFDGGDRTDINLPAPQQALLEALKQTGKPLVVVLNSGSAVAVNWAQKEANAVLEAWYPGEEGGTAMAEIAAGKVSPSGRLPVTFYKSVDGLPAFTDYSMSNRTYRYFRGETLYRFGYGLGYSKFVYSAAKLSKTKVSAGESLTAVVDVKNTGTMDADEVVEMYVTPPKTAVSPQLALAGFQRVHLAAGETKHVTLAMDARGMSEVDATGRRAVVAGEYEVSIGGAQPGDGSEVTRRFVVVGSKELAR